MQQTHIMALGYVYKVATPEWQFVTSQAQHAADLRASQQSQASIFDPAEDFWGCPVLTDRVDEVLSRYLIDWLVSGGFVGGG
ncbi:hypothetical protein ABZ345_46615, partial [Lentzea sp. NPDC005914]|uniref:hypothetical protein n=1 Tax=Lentzea sp. NPDC005914 TaxID=3154572 RepID=UPI003408A34E